MCQRLLESAGSAAALLLAVAFGWAGALSAQQGVEDVSDLRILSGHSDTVYQLGFSPDGELLATTSFDRTVKLWRTRDASEFATLAGHDGKVLSVAFSPDGRSLVSGSEDRTLKLWSIPKGGPVEMAAHEGALHSVVSSPDGRWVATSGEDRKVVLWDRATGKPELEIADLPAPVLRLAFASRAALLGASSDRRLRAWALPPPPAPESGSGSQRMLVDAGATWKIFRGTKAPPGTWKEQSFDDSGWEDGRSGFGYSANEAELKTVETRVDMRQKYLTVFVRKRFEIADPARVERLVLRVLYDDGFVAYLNGAEIGRANVDGSPPAFDAGAKSAGEPQTTELDLAPHLDRLRRGANVLAIQGHNANKTSSDFVLTPVLGVVERPEPERDDEERTGSLVFEVEIDKPTEESTGEHPPALAVQPAGNLAAVTFHGAMVTVVQLTGDRSTSRFEWPESSVRGLAFVGDDTLAGAGDDGAIRFVDIGGKKEPRSVEGHGDAERRRVLGLASSPARKLLATAGEDGTVRLWSFDGEARGKLTGASGPVHAVAFSPDGALVVAASGDRTLRAWNVDDGKSIASFPHDLQLRDVAVHQQGQYFSAGAGPHLLDWRVETLEEKRTLSGHDNLVHAVAFSSDGRTIASAGSDKTVRLWNVSDGQLRHTIKAHDGSVYCLAFSPDGQWLASGSYDRSVKVWKVADGSELRKMTSHADGVFCVAFTADGKTLFSGSSDRTIAQWNVEAGGDPVRVLEGHPGWIMDLEVIRGQGKLVSVDHGGHLFVWNLETGTPETRSKLPAVVHGFAISTDGELAASANADGTCYLFRTPHDAPRE